MRDIILKWCNSNQLSMEDAYLIISEYLSYDERTITTQELQAILNVGNMFPINWDYLIYKIAGKNNLEIIKVESPADQRGARRIIARKLYDNIENKWLN